MRADGPVMRSNPEIGVSGWHEEFTRQQQQLQVGGGTGKQTGVSSMADNGNLWWSMSNNALDRLQARPSFGMHRSGEGAHDDFQRKAEDNAAFEAAFAHAESGHEQPQHNTPNTGKLASVTVDPTFNTKSDKPDASQPGAFRVPETCLPPNFADTEPSSIRIGSDVIPPAHHTGSTTLENSHHDADELARTAGQLLSSVSHETSPKFLRSQFMDLMRRVRDGEMEVHDEQFQETNKTEKGYGNDVNKLQKLQQGQQPEDERQDDALLGYWDQSHRLSEEISHPLMGGVRGEGVATEEFTRATDREGATESGYPLREHQKTQRPLEEQRWLDEVASSAQGDVQDLHPGGRGYPYPSREEPRANEASREIEDERHRYDHWASGGIGLEDERLEENPGLAARFRLTQSGDGARIET